jgi:hypothetical protein
MLRHLCGHNRRFDRRLSVATAIEMISASSRASAQLRSAWGRSLCSSRTPACPRRADIQSADGIVGVGPIPDQSHQRFSPSALSSAIAPSYSMNVFGQTVVARRNSRAASSFAPAAVPVRPYRNSPRRPDSFWFRHRDRRLRLERPQQSTG